MYFRFAFWPGSAGYCFNLHVIGADSLTRDTVAKAVDFAHSKGAFGKFQRDAVVLESSE